MFSIISLMSFTPVWDAASISMTSSDLPSAISTQNEHSEQGLGVGPSLQLRAFARILALDVLPTPRGTENKSA